MWPPNILYTPATGERERERDSSKCLVFQEYYKYYCIRHYLQVDKFLLSNVFSAVEGTFFFLIMMHYLNNAVLILYESEKVFQRPYIINQSLK